MITIILSYKRDNIIYINRYEFLITHQDYFHENLPLREKLRYHDHHH